MNPSDCYEPLKLVNGKVIGADIDTAAYLRQGDVKRGDPNFVISRSELMLFRSNPQRWIRGYEFKDTDATEWGTLIDCLLTSPQTFEKRFALQPDTVTATKTMAIVKEGEAEVGDKVPWQPLCKEAKDWNREAKARGLRVVKAGDYADASSAMQVLRQDAWIAEMLNGASFQVMAIATYVDSETKIEVPLKCLMDILPSMKGQFANAIIDFKTARTADPDTWNTVTDKQNYDAQAVMSLDIYGAAMPQERWVFNHIIQENQFPWQQARRYMSDTYLAIGRIKVLTALKQYCQCLKDNAWPSWDDAGATALGCGPINPKEWLITQYGLVR